MPKGTRRAAQDKVKKLSKRSNIFGGGAHGVNAPNFTGTVKLTGGTTKIKKKATKKAPKKSSSGGFFESLRGYVKKNFIR